MFSYLILCVVSSDQRYLFEQALLYLGIPLTNIVLEVPVPVYQQKPEYCERSAKRAGEERILRAY